MGSDRPDVWTTLRIGHLRNWCAVIVVVGLLLVSGRAMGANLPNVDGVALSIQSREGAKGEELRAYELKAGSPTGSTVLYRSEDRIVSACISPFGNAAAFVAPGGTLMVVDIDGKNARELADDALWVQWPAGDGGRWVYFIDAGDKSTLRRANVETSQVEKLVTFDRTVQSGAMSMDASADSGWMVLRVGDAVYAGVYPMARGNGLTWSVPQWWEYTDRPGQRASISPDNTVFAIVGSDGTLLIIGMPAFDNDPAAFRLDPMNYRNRPRDWYRTFDWNMSRVADPHYLKEAIRVEERLDLKQARFVDPVFAVDMPGWLGLTQLNYPGDPASTKPTSSDMLLWDAPNMAHHGIPSHVSITANQPGTFDRALGFWQRLPAEYQLGYFDGKAPFTVKFEDKRFTEEMTWDFGDGSPRAKGRTATHTYKSAGRFTVVAEKEPWAKQLQAHQKGEDPGLFFAEVNVADAAAPTGEAQLVDSNHAVVEFSERMQAKKDAEVGLGGKKVAKWELTESGRLLTMELAEPIQKAEKIQIKGLTDLAQRPNGLKSESLDLAMPQWPTNPNKLVYCFANAGQHRFTVTPDGTIRRCELFRDGPPSGFDDLGRMKLGVGGMRANPRSATTVGKGDFGEIVLNDTFTFECTFKSDDLSQQEFRRPPLIVSLGSHRPFVSLFQIGQQADRLLVGIKTIDNWLEDMGPPHGYPTIPPEKRKGSGVGPYGHGPWVEVGQLKDTNPHHLVVTYKPGEMIVYMDGKRIFQTDRVTGDLDWGFGVLMFGSHHGLSGGGEQWDGRMEGIAFYSRVLPPEEVQRNAEAYAKKTTKRQEKLREVSE